MLTKPFKPLALAFLVNLIISVEDKIKYSYNNNLMRRQICYEKCCFSITLLVSIHFYQQLQAVIEKGCHILPIGKTKEQQEVL